MLSTRQSTHSVTLVKIMWGFCTWVLKSQLLHDVISGFPVRITSSFTSGCLMLWLWPCAHFWLLPAGLMYAHLVSLWPCPDGTFLGYSSIGSLCFCSAELRLSPTFPASIPGTCVGFLAHFIFYLCDPPGDKTWIIPCSCLTTHLLKQVWDGGRGKVRIRNVFYCVPS